MNPRILKVREYEEVEVPQELILQGGELSAYPEVLSRDYFSVRYRKGKLVFQAGGYLGLVPVNKEFSLEISAKVPVSNLERMLLMTQHDPYVLKRLTRLYNPHPSAPEAIYRFLIDSFTQSLSKLHASGLLKTYSQQSSAGTFLKGRIDFKNTFLLRAKYQLPKIASSWAERHADNPANRLLKFVLTELLANRLAPLDRKQRRLIAVMAAHFDHVCLDNTRKFLTDRLVQNPNELPSTKLHYREAIVLGKMLLKREGIELKGNQGPVKASSFIVNMDDVFEQYVLEALNPMQKSCAGLKVLNGNKGGDEGGKQMLFCATKHPAYVHNEVLATPDILLHFENAERKVKIVIDVKYKVVKQIVDRADLNQIITYAASYQANHALLILPAISVKSVGLHGLGKIGDANIFQYFIDLSSSNMEQEEEKLRNCMQELLNYFEP